MVHHVALIIVAAGSGQRFGAPDKVFVDLDGIPALARLVETVAAIPAIDQVVVVTSDHSRGRVQQLVAAHAGWTVVVGGGRRQDSVRAGLAALQPATTIVVHDGARPLATAALFDAVIAAVEGGADAAIPVISLTDTLKRVAGARVVETLDRSTFALAQTPQAFRREALEAALETAATRGLTVTDEATLVEQLGGQVIVVAGSTRNLKLTHPEDRAMAEAIIAGAEAGPPVLRTGIGYDVHRLVPGRRLVLGGIHVPFERGLDGHSDADVLLHAIADALLGAVALGDIGRHFPPDDPAYQDADSLVLLGAVRQLIVGVPATVVNVDATVIAEAPRLLPYVEQMRTAIAAALHLPVDRVGVKATTNEGMGFPGRGEGIAALAVATVSTPAAPPVVG